MVILLKGSLIIAQNDSFIENSEEQEEGLKVKMLMIRLIIIQWQDLIEMTMHKMDKDRDGKVSFEDYQATVSARYVVCSECETPPQVKEEPLLLEAFGEFLTHGNTGRCFRESVLDLPEKQRDGVSGFLQ